MDSTSIGIASGVLVTFAYAVVRAIRQKSFDIGSTLLVFLATFCIPAGGQLIYAAWTGDTNSLSSAWREYVAVAGVAAMGLSLEFLVRSMRGAIIRQAVSESGIQSEKSESIGESH